MSFWRRMVNLEKCSESDLSEGILKTEISFHNSQIKRYEGLIQEYKDNLNEAMVKKNAYELALKYLNVKDNEG